MKEIPLDVLVIGGGAAGMGAAIKAKENGAERVGIVEINNELSGVLNQCLHPGFGVHYFREIMTGPEYGTRLQQKVKDLGIETYTSTFIIRVKPDIIALSRSGVCKFIPKAIVFATGCRERHRGALKIPGTRPAGVFTAGQAQTLMDVYGYIPGKSVVILGSGDIGLIMARRFAMLGYEVKAVVEIMQYPGGLARNVQQCLYDFGIPLYLSHTITRIFGNERVEGVTIQKVDSQNRPIPGTESQIACDTVILSVGLIPETHLLEELGAEIDPRTRGSVVNEYMETTVPGVFAAGNLVLVFDLVDKATICGEIAGKNAALCARGELPRPSKWIRIVSGKNVRHLIPQLVSGSNTVNVYLRATHPIEKAILKIGSLNIKKEHVRPIEVIEQRVPLSVFEGIQNELKIDIEEVS
ncbi:MAG: FAD-dependent oxidoreductase [Candidatus Korarchaeota archaeon]